MNENTNNPTEPATIGTGNKEIKFSKELTSIFIKVILKKVEAMLSNDEQKIVLAKDNRQHFHKYVAPAIVNFISNGVNKELKSLIEGKEDKLARQLYNGSRVGKITLRNGIYRKCYFEFIGCDDTNYEEKLLSDFSIEEDRAPPTIPLPSFDTSKLTEDLTYFVGFYYSVREYAVKKFGIAYNHKNESNGRMEIYEWGFHDNTTLSFPNFKSWILLQEPVEEQKDAKASKGIKTYFQTTANENKGIDEAKLDTDHDFHVPTKIVEEVQYSGWAKIQEKEFYGNLTDGARQLNLICIIDNENLMQGTLQTIADNNPISVEVFLLRAKNKKEAFPLDISAIYNQVGTESGNTLKNLVCYLMVRRRNYVVRFNTEQLLSLKSTGVKLTEFRKKMTGTFRVWNLNEKDEVVQSRIIVDENYRCFLFPYFENLDDADKMLKVQFCTFNLNSRSTGKVWIPSFDGLKATNIAIVDYLEKGDVYRGVFGSVGIGGSVIGDYMAWKRDERDFKVRKIGSLLEAKDYAKEFGLQDLFKTLIDFLKSRQNRNLADVD